MNVVRMQLKDGNNINDHPEVDNFLRKFQHHDQFSFILNNKDILQIFSMVLSYFVITEQFSEFMEDEN